MRRSFGCVFFLFTTILVSQSFAASNKKRNLLPIGTAAVAATPAVARVCVSAVQEGRTLQPTILQGSHDNQLVGLSVALAMVAAYAALDLARRITAAQKRAKIFWLAGGATAMGVGIWAMHYIGMLGVTSFLVMILAILFAFIDRRLAVRSAFANAARDGEARFRLFAEAIPQIVWTAVPGGGIDFCSERWTEITGVPTREALGMGWQNSLHPDDLPIALQNWDKARRTGVTLEIEYRLRDRSGGYRWNLVRATPVRDADGKIVKWFGACTDIDDQMRTQQLLEEQVKQHTAALMEANRRLETEMSDRARAQQELNQQNEQMLLELTQRSNRATILAKMSELLQSCVDLKDVLSVVGGMAPKIFPELRGAVLLFNSSREVLETAASWADCQLPAAVFEAQDCWAVRTGHLHRVTAGDSTAACRHVVRGEYSYLCLPLLSQGVPVGILHFQMIHSGELPESVMQHATMFAEQVGLSVANLRLREALRNQSIRDPLTGLFNRRYLEEMLTREVRRAVRSEQSLGLLMLDLDHFKKFNDTYGHDAGDTVLRETASFLTRSVRSEDIVCRFGGEEFVVILPLATLKVTHARAERIRSKLRELTVLHQGHSLGMITVSAGVAALPDHGTDPKALLDVADAALYRAKREGRDRVISAEASLRAEAQELASEAGR